MTRKALTALGLAAVALSAWGCGALDRDGTGHDGRRDPLSERAADGEAKPTTARPRLPRCPRGAANCRRAGGRVIYVEPVDADGEGDAHLVLASREAITAPGVTVVDLEPRVRPARLPRVGDWVGAAGPVYPGSHGQRQIEATGLRVRRAAGRPRGGGGRR